MYNQACWGKPAIPALPLETKVGRQEPGASLTQTHNTLEVNFSPKKREKEKEKNGVMGIGLNREKKQWKRLWIWRRSGQGLWKGLGAERKGRWFVILLQSQ